MDTALSRFASRVFRGFVWLVVIVQALAMVDAGMGKFQSMEGWMHWFRVFGYPGWFAIVIGVLEICGGLLLLVPGLSAYSAALLFVIMMGALHAVTTHTTDLSAFDPAFNAGLQALVIAARWNRRWHFRRMYSRLDYPRLR